MKSILLLALAALYTVTISAQALVSAIPKDTVLDKSAILELKSFDRGLLLPRVSTAKRRAIKNPAPGLVVFDTTQQVFYGYVKEFGWRPFLMGYDTIPIYNGDSPTVPGVVAGDKLGVGVAIRGNIALAGAPETTVSGHTKQGAVYVFRNDGDGWKVVQKITTQDGAANDLFGTQTVLTDEFAFVASTFHDVSGKADEGAVYVYKIQNDTLVFHQKLVAAEGAPFDGFGFYTTVSGKDLFIGAPFTDVNGNNDQGAAYYFSLENGYWVQKQRIIQDSASASKDYFGFGFSIDSNYVAIGGTVDNSVNYGYGQNAVFIYEKINNLWQRRQKIVQPEQPGASQRNDAFGYITYLKGNKLLAGAWMRDEPSGNKDRGVIYQFTKNGNHWDYTGKISPTDVNPGDIYGDYFSQNFSVDGQYMISGSGYEDIAANNVDKGAVYVYEWVNNNWVQKRKIISPTPTQLDLFGHVSAISNGTVIISASSAENNKGKIYFYTLP